MDGVLADFEGTWFKLTGTTFSDYPSNNAFWNAAKEYQNIYRILHKMHDADDLVEGIMFAFSDMEIEVLTAVPLLTTFPTAASDKEEWIQEHYPYGWKFKIGPHAKDKHKHAAPGDILIDDKALNIEQWIAAGGIGILHTSADDTLDQLCRLGV